MQLTLEQGASLGVGDVPPDHADGSYLLAVAGGGSGGSRPWRWGTARAGGWARILDEAQHVPDLFSYIQGIVDERDQPGQFVLAGSPNFLIHRQISQSLAGRCDILHLLPFSRAELKRRKLHPVEAITDRRPRSRENGEDRLNDVLFAGGHPRIHDKKLEPQRWLANCYQTYIERDVRELVNVGDVEAFGRLMGLCAGRTGQLLNLSALANDCGITHTTARRWLSVLETSFVVMLLRPHHRNFNKRLVKSPKLYCLDTGRCATCCASGRLKTWTCTRHAGRSASRGWWPRR